MYLFIARLALDFGFRLMIFAVTQCPEDEFDSLKLFWNYFHSSSVHSIKKKKKFKRKREKGVFTRIF